jgi:hypothetical protein
MTFSHMTRTVLIIAGVFAVAPAASAACRSFGTQLECDVLGQRIVIGTQTAEEPSRARSLPIQSFHGDIPSEHQASAGTFEIQLQDFGRDPSLCRRIGNETYCY